MLPEKLEENLPEKYSQKWLINEGINTFFDSFINGLSLPIKQTVSEWAEKNRKLSSESSADVGDWSTSRAEYQREIMNTFTDPNIKKITLMASSQIGKTEIMNNCIGYVIDKDPGPILLVQPSLELAESWSKIRFSPMVRDTKILNSKINNLKSRDSNNTIREKVFPGGYIIMAGANSPASLSSRPIRYLFLDEKDRYPYSAGVEGDPSEIAEKRTATFWNKKIFEASSPTLKGESRIEKNYEESDKRMFYVPCPHCGQHQVLRWTNLKWDKDNDGRHHSETARYLCDSCGRLWNDVERWSAISKGHWKQSKESKGHAGFWLWEAYSSWVTLEDMVDRWLSALDKGPEYLKVFVNTSLGQVWEDKGERVDENILIKRREEYEGAPADVIIITAGVDVQNDRIEIDRFGWGFHDQCWGLGKFVLQGDPTGEKIWEELDDILRTPIKHEKFGEMEIMATGVDSGYLTQNVGHFCQPRWGRHIWATKGTSGFGRPIWAKSPNKMKGVDLSFFNVGVDAAKEVIYSRLRIEDKESPGFIHFNQSYDENHFQQLTAEEVKKINKGGRHVRFWKLKEGRKRNEALDMLVYAYAAKEGLLLSGLQLRRKYDNLCLERGIKVEGREDIKKDIVKKKGRRVIGSMLS